MIRYQTKTKRNTLISFHQKRHKKMTIVKIQKFHEQKIFNMFTLTE